MIRGTLHPIGSRVRLKDGGPDMLIVDLDPVRREVVAAWRDGTAVSERTFRSDSIEPVVPA
jgi:uncharacterized protein YodC (DUF2158 family)